MKGINWPSSSKAWRPVASPTSYALHLGHLASRSCPWWCLIYPWWFCNLQWLRPAGIYERCKLTLELKSLKTPSIEVVSGTSPSWIHANSPRTTASSHEVLCFYFPPCLIHFGESCVSTVRSLHSVKSTLEWTYNVANDHNLMHFLVQIIWRTVPFILVVPYNVQKTAKSMVTHSLMKVKWCQVY